MKLEIHKPTSEEVLHAVLSGRKTVLVARPAPEAWEALQAAFQIMCEELGIADQDYTVDVSFVNSLKAGPQADGATERRNLHPIEMELKIDNGFQVLGVLAHEMFHVRDLVKGFMTDKNGVELYHGQPVFNLPKHGENIHMIQPDEIEAYQGMFPLALKVLDRLPPKVAKVFTEDYLADVRPPTLREYYLHEAQELENKIKKAKQTSQDVVD